MRANRKEGKGQNPKKKKKIRKREKERWRRKKARAQAGKKKSALGPRRVVDEKAVQRRRVHSGCHPLLLRQTPSLTCRLFYRGEKFNYKKVLAFRQFGLVAIYRSNSRTLSHQAPSPVAHTFHPSNPLQAAPSASPLSWQGPLSFRQRASSL